MIKASSKIDNDLKKKVKSEFKELLDSLRTDSDDAISLDEITEEVEAVRKARYEI